MSRAYDESMDSLAPRILVVDDEDAIRDLLEYGLSHAGFAVRGATDGPAALKLIDQWAPDAIVLDLMLPHIDGYALLPMIRRLTDVPIIMLSAKGSPPERVAGLVRGADDYLGKPFDMDELIARIHSWLRRPRLETRHVLHCADLSLDVTRRAAKRGNREIDLSQREFDLLLNFMRNPGHVLAREQLLDQVWGTDKDVGPSTVDTYISYLRAKIDSNADRKLLHTIRGVGYVLREKPP
jgi:DNA-binding response OmpR family regulator